MAGLPGPWHATGERMAAGARRTVRLGKPADDQTYGWDNEYGVEEVALPAFRAARRLVSNAEFLEFVADGGYRDESVWTEEGRGWLHYTRAEHPKFWRPRGGDWLRQRNLLEEMPLPLDWPVEVNCLEAQAYCAWLAAQTGENVRCPPRPTGRPSATACRATSPRGTWRRATSTSSTSRRAAR